jgi:hypothetical protein
MTLEQLIQEYLAIPNNYYLKSNYDDYLKEQDCVADVAKQEYIPDLCFLILDLIWHENNKTLLKYIINVYASKLTRSQIPKELYKRYLALNISDQHMCKEFVNFMNNNWPSGCSENGRHLYRAILDEDYTTAKEILEKV